MRITSQKFNFEKLYLILLSKIGKVYINSLPNLNNIEPQFLNFWPNNNPLRHKRKLIQ
ncbi:hypothetical protein SAMN05421761_111124 [Belliella pelovolcani]|uniref:Uncharacterized protein n=1 Tax=Belliella pelovolcani TaxID=529505 RepID=A0A1N7NST1_9BACT|nr:hypothetical protein SAMN05421761_111124 [Belliella pelovolcani]